MYTQTVSKDRLTREALVAIRRDLHANPELRFNELRTSEQIFNILTKLGWLVQRGIGQTGLLAVWPEGNGKGNGNPRILLRADMDAYPVQDIKKVPYASGIAGVTHACGHDIHMTVLLGLADRLRFRPELRGSVALMFQPAEEIPFGQDSGARAMLDSGALASSYTAVLGLHCWPELPVGSIGVDIAAAMAAKDAFSVTFSGKTAHVATPATGRDAIVAASNCVMSLHSILARERNPPELVAFNIGTIQGGRSQSSLAESVEITGTIRTHDPIVRQRLKKTIERVCNGTTTTFDLATKIVWANEMPILENSPELVSLALKALPESNITTIKIDTPPLASDDFALLSELGPLLYLKLGVAEKEERLAPPLHAGNFDVNEDCIEVGISVLEILVDKINEGMKS
jgi:amidohydrolase